MVENFHLNLSAMGMAGKREFDAHFRGAIEGIGIVRKENVGDVAADERLKLREGLDFPAASRALAA